MYYRITKWLNLRLTTFVKESDIPSYILIDMTLIGRTLLLVLLRTDNAVHLNAGALRLDDVRPCLSRAWNAVKVDGCCGSTPTETCDPPFLWEFLPGLLGWHVTGWLISASAVHRIDDSIAAELDSFGLHIFSERWF